MSEAKVNILYLSHSAQLYGAEQSLLQLLNGLDRGRFSPLVVLPQEGPLEQRIADLSIPVEVVPSVREWLTRRDGVGRLFHHVGLVPFLIRSVWALTRLIRRYSIELVHTNSLVIISGALAAFLSGIPHVWHAREVLTYEAPYHFLFGRLGHRTTLSVIDYLSDRIIAISSAVCQSLGQADAVSKSTIVYNAVDVSAFDRTAHRDVTRQSLNTPDGVYLIGEVGKLAPVKGYEGFVMAAAQVHQVMPNTRFIGVGDARHESDKQRIVELITQMGMQSSFVLLGFRHDVADIVAALDLLVLPSYYEPFGRVLVEAMAAGKPVIGTNVGGIPEIIEEGVTGLLVPSHSPGDLAQAIIKVLQDPDLARRMGAAGRERARAHFSPERYVAEIQEIYEELIKEIRAEEEG